MLTCSCRYHYNVADARLAQHIEKGNEDGLYISCVASCQNLWALIMDAGTNFSAQVYELSPHFLHKVHTSLIMCALVSVFIPNLLLGSSVLNRCCALIS